MRSVNSLVCAAALSALASCATTAEPNPPPVVRPPQVLRATPQFHDLAGPEHALREATLHQSKLATLHARLDIRTIAVLPRDGVSLPSDNEALLELRTGSLATETDGKIEERVPGDMWLAPKGSKITLKVHGELAVVRAIYLLPGD